METMNYYCQQIITLENINAIAIASNYQTAWLSDIYFDHIRLNIHFGSEKSQWWQWYKMNLDELWFDSEADKERVRSLDSPSILLFEYYSNSLSEVAEFMRDVMEKYGGWLDCKGDASNLITIDRLDELVNACP